MFEGLGDLWSSGGVIVRISEHTPAHALGSTSCSISLVSTCWLSSVGPIDVPGHQLDSLHFQLRNQLSYLTQQYYTRSLHPLARIAVAKHNE